MTSTVREPESAHLADDGAETVAMLTGLEPRGIGPAWNCREHVPGSIASWIVECRRFGGGRRRREAAKAAYDAIWAGQGLGERGDEPCCAPGVITAAALAVTGSQQGSSDHATTADRPAATRRRRGATPLKRVRQP